ncbi:MAG: FtsW/RodA/SpoVE family cell cycle protein [Bacteroidota bacterium]
MLYTTPHSNSGADSYILGQSAEDMDTPSQGSDRYVLMAVIALMMFGVLAVYSSIAYFAETKGTTAGSLITGHLFKIGIAFVVMLLLSKFDYHKLAKFSRLGVIISWILLVAVLLFGSETFGAKRSLNVAGFSFQPSSLASLALLLHVSVLLYEKQEYIKDLKRSFVPILFWITTTCALIGIEDFSSAGLLFSICLLLMFIGRVSMLHLGTIVMIGMLGGTALVMSSPERQSRINHYVDQIVDIKSNAFALGEGYQAQQAQIAIAQGQITGVGIGKSTQRDFLPAPYNDFIFAIIAEEYGLVGSLGLILIYTLILIRGVVFIARKAPDSLGMLLATACTLMVVMYGFVNAGVASGILPVTGLPMPFVSYGGTSMLFSGAMVGILLNVSKSKRPKRLGVYY